MKNRHAIQAYKLQAFQKKEADSQNGNSMSGDAQDGETLSKDSRKKSSGQEPTHNESPQNRLHKVSGLKSSSQTPGDGGAQPEIFHSDEVIGRNGFLKTGFGHKKAAKLLLLLGKEQAATVLKHLSQEEIEKVTGEIAKIKRIERPEAEKILEEFGDITGQIAANPRGGVDTARDMLKASFGKEKADEILKKVHPYSGDRPFAFLNDMDYQQIMLLLRKEPVHVMSIVLAYLQPDKASQVLESLPPELQQQTVKRMARMGEVSPEVLSSVEESLRERIRKQGKMISEEIDGQSVLADILKHMTMQDENRILDNLHGQNSSLADEIRQKLFSIESVLEIPDKQLQELLQKYPDRDIATMLKGKSEELEAKILQNVSQRRREFIRSEREHLGAMRRSEVEKVTRDFMTFVRSLAEQGELTLQRDELV